MQNVSSSYLEKIKEPSRSFECRVTIGNNVYTNIDIINISIEDVQPSDGFTIGAAVSKSLELTLSTNNTIYSNSKVKLEIGLNIGSTFEYILIGHFHIEDIISTDYSTKLTCYDNMIKFEKPYFSNLGKTSTLKDIVNELATITGVEFTGSLPSYNLSKLEGFTCRDVLGFVASICGGNAYITREGKFTIKTPAIIDYSITSDNYIDLKSEEDLYKVGAITCKANDKELTKGTLSNSSMEITFENPWVTESILTDIYNKLKGFEFIGYSMKWQGDFSLDVGDIISITDTKGNTRQVPIFSQKLTYNGGLTSEIGAKGESKTKNEFSPTGDLNNKVNRVVTDLLIVNKALINKADVEDLKAVNGEIDNLIAVNVTITGKLNAIEGEFGTIKSDVAAIENLTVNHTAKINDLIANKASITQVEAVSAQIGIVEADVGKINTLLAGNLTSTNIQAGGITSDKLTIANGFITNAMIANLDVSKINAGDISTNKFRIKSDNGGIEIVGATQQFKDKNNRVRIQMGQDTQGNFNFIIRGEDGTTTLIDHTGIKEKAISDDLIKSEMISSDAVGEKQINYSSFITGFNKDTNTNTIKSTKIMLNNENQTLDVAFNQLKTYSETTKTQLDNLDVGVRNIFLNSSLTDNLDKWSFQSTSPTFTTKDNKKCAKISGALKSSRSIYQGIFGKLEPNTTYTMSGWVYTENIVKGETNFILSYYIDGFYVDNGASKWFGCGKKELPLNSNKWVYLTWTFTTDSRISTSTSMLAYLYARDFTGSVYVYNLKLEKGNKATVWMPAVEDVDGAIESVKEVTESHSTTIGVMQGQISTAINNTKIVKDGQTILLKDDYNRTVQTVDSMKVTIGQHTSKIDGLNSTVSTQTSDISQLKNQIKLKVEQTDINTAVNKIQIGVKNILINTALKDNANSFGLNSSVKRVTDKKTPNNNNCFYFSPIGLTENKYNRAYQTINRTKFVVGRTYTFSANVFVPNIHEIDMGATLEIICFDANGVRTATKSKGINKNRIDEWVKIAQEVTIPANTTKIECQIYVIRNGKLYAGDYKFEESNKYSDWSPAPEDVDDSIDKVDTKINTTNNKVSSIETNLSSITSRVGTVESKQTTTDGKVTSLETRMSSAEQKMTKEAITSTVKESFYTKAETESQITSKGYQTASQVQQTVNALEIKFSETGGYNLVSNGQFKNEFTYWNKNGTVDLTFNNPYQLYEGTGLMVACKALNTGIYQVVNTIPGQVYSFSMMINSEINMIVGFEDANCVAYPIANYTWTRYTGTFVATKNTHAIVAYSRQNEGCFYISNICVEKGGVSPQYSPSPHEVYDGITKLDKDGITVTSSNVKSKTSVSANGFKITKTDTNEDVFKVNSNGRLLLDGEFTTHNGTRKSGYFGSDQVKFYNWWSDTNEEIAYFYGGKTSDNKRSADIVGRDMFSIGIGTPTSGSKVLEGSSSKLFIYKNTDFGNYKISNLNGINEGTSKDIWLGNTFLRSNQLNTNIESGILNLNYWKGYNSTGSVEVKVGNGNNDSARGTLTCQNFKAYGTKNACVQTSVGYVDINAYETCDYYFGDIGETILDNEGYSYVYIDSLFSETVNTQRKYQVFLSIYGEGTANVVKRTPIYFVIKGTPGIEVGYEIKAKRKGYEDYRLERDINPWRKGEEHGLDEDYNNERIEFNRKIENIINEEVIKDIENETLQEFISSEVERSIENIELLKTIEEDILNENIN